MDDQTPPVAAKAPTEGQWAKYTNVGRDAARKAGIDRDDLQDILGSPELAGIVGKLFADYKAKRRCIAALLEREPLCTCPVGVLPTVEVMRNELTGASVQISPWANDILATKEFASRIEGAVQEDIEFCWATVEELGRATGQDFSRGATITQIYAAARQLGWETCQPEDIVSIRLATLDQEVGWFVVSMDPPITASYGYRNVFSVGRGGHGLWLGGSYGSPGGCCDPECRFVFRRK